MIYINAESPNPKPACKQLESLGLTIETTRPAPSWNGKPPETLIIASVPDFSTTLARGLLRFTVDHKQECVAVRFSHNVGMLIGVTEHRYDEDYFFTH